MERLMTKTEVMNLVASGKVHETFDHETEGKFDVTAMRAYAMSRRLPTLKVRIADVYARLCKDRVIDWTRVDELDEASWKDDPAMVILLEEGSHLLIDGTHRILRRHKEGAFVFKAWFIEERFAIRPDMTQWIEGTQRGIDWGDRVEGDKIIKR